MRFLLLFFIAVPIVEMFVLIKVGGIIGALSTIALVLLTAMVGLALLRRQGPSTLLRAQKKLQRGEVPAKELVEGVFLAVGGALLLTPGFVTDALGFCCLIPGIRHVIIGWGMRNIRVQAFGASSRGGYGDGANDKTFGHMCGDDSQEKTHVIDGEYKRED